MDVRPTNSINLDNDFAKDFLQISRKVTLGRSKLKIHRTTITLDSDIIINNCTASILKCQLLVLACVRQKIKLDFAKDKTGLNSRGLAFLLQQKPGWKGAGDGETDSPEVYG